MKMDMMYGLKILDQKVKDINTPAFKIGSIKKPNYKYTLTIPLNY